MRHAQVELALDPGAEAQRCHGNIETLAARLTLARERHERNDAGRWYGEWPGMDCRRKSSILGYNLGLPIADEPHAR